jgi:hypothetical protein
VISKVRDHDHDHDHEMDDEEAMQKQEQPLEDYYSSLYVLLVEQLEHAPFLS